MAHYVFGDELKPGERWKRRLLSAKVVLGPVKARSPTSHSQRSEQLSVTLTGRERQDWRGHPPSSVSPRDGKGPPI